MRLPSGLHAAYLLSVLGLGFVTIQESLRPTIARRPSSVMACDIALKAFLKYQVGPGGRLMAKYRTRKGLSLFNPLNGLRRWSLYHLQVKHGHDYPSIAIDEAPRAYGWAKNAFKKLTDEDAALLQVGDITSELKANLAKVNSYKNDLQALVDQAENLAVKIKAYELALEKAKKGQRFDIDLSFPQIERDAEGVAREIINDDFKGTLAGLAIELKNSRADASALSAKANARGAEQVSLLYKLETFRKEFKRVATDSPGVEAPEEARDIINQIRSLYANFDTAAGFRAELSPPPWTWENMKWAQWWGEMKSLLFHDIPALKDKSRLVKLVKYIANLSPEEKRMLSLGNAADSVEWYKRWKPVRMIMSNPWTAGGATVGAGTAATWLKTVIFEDTIKKEECAGKALGSDDFVNCGLEYLENKFPLQAHQAEKDLQSVFTASGEFTIPKMKVEVEDLKKRRRKFIYQENAKNGQKEPTRASLKGIDPSHPSYKETLIHIVDEKEFNQTMFDLDYRKGWLMLKYSVFYKRADVQSMVKSIYSAKPETRVELFKVLKNMQQQKDDRGDLQPNPMLIEMANDLDEIIGKRIEFLATLESPVAQAGLEKSALDALVEDANSQNSDVKNPVQQKAEEQSRQ